MFDHRGFRRRQAIHLLGRRCVLTDLIWKLTAPALEEAPGVPRLPGEAFPSRCTASEPLPPGALQALDLYEALLREGAQLGSDVAVDLALGQRLLEANDRAEGDSCVRRPGWRDRPDPTTWEARRRDERSRPDVRARASARAGGTERGRRPACSCRCGRSSARSPRSSRPGRSCRSW